MDFALPFVGFIIGTLIGMTGMGGGSLMTPILVISFGISPSVAVGTDLLYAAVTKCSGVWVHNQRKTIQWDIVGLLAAGSLPSAVLTVIFLRQLKALEIDYERLISLVLSVALILTSLVLVFRSRILPLATVRLHSVTVPFRRHRKLFTVVAGVLVGVLVTLSSVGAGVLGVAMLLLLYPGMSAIAIAGTDLAYAVPLTAIAGLGHLQIGHVDYALLGSLLIGALPGTYLGAHFGSRLPDRVVRPILAACLFTVGVRVAF